MTRPFARLLAAAGLCLLALLAYAEEEPPSTQDFPASGMVSAEILESKIAETEAAADLSEEVKTPLVERYRKALTNLQTASSNAEAAAAFRRSAETGPAEIQALREGMDESNVAPPLESLAADASTPLRDLELMLQKEQANLAAVDARRADFERRLTYQEARPAAVNQRLAEARQRQEEVAAETKSPQPVDEGPALAKARRWELESRYLALSTEIKMLDQELLSHSLRLALMEAKRDKEAASVAWIGERVKALKALINRKRQLDAAAAKEATAKAVLETEGMPPLLKRLSAGNAVLSDEVNVMAAQLQGLDREREQAAKLAARIAADYKDARATLEASGLTEGLGAVLLEQRNSLPDIAAYRFKARGRERHIAEVSVRWLGHQAEARRIADLDQTLAELELELQGAQTPLLRERLRQLVEQRQSLLERALEADEFYLSNLRGLDRVEGEMLDSASAYDQFLIEHLVWLQNLEPTDLADLVALPEEFRRLLATAREAGVADAFMDGVPPAPVIWLGLLAAVLLIWRRKALIVAIAQAGKRVGKPSTDAFGHSLRALGWTMLAAAPGALLLALLAWQLHLVSQGVDLTQAVAATLARVALHLYILRLFHAICLPRGLAAAHFRWPEASLRLLRTALDRLTWLLVPALLIGRLAIDLNPSAAGGLVTRLGFLAAYGALTLFLFRVLHPRRGVLAYLRPRYGSGLLFRAYLLWFPLLLLFPGSLVVLALGGYMYSAVALSFILVHSLWLLLGLVLVNALWLRWLRVIRRRLAYEAALERLQATRAASQSGKSAGGEDSGIGRVEEPEVDLVALSEDSRALVKIAVAAGGVFGLYLIWSDILPALRIFEDVTLWDRTVSVDGEDKRLPITLADLGLALLYLAGIVILAKRLPALLEIILLRRFHMSSGSRYTFTTLTNYAVVATGVLLVFNSIGAQWSQLQWLVAALGVGIGFGLQEIVANFISGLIILFERPIRVGDIVSVGETDGVVTKIRIRATTIRNWDRKELLVPNKEFITGRLLNWSLSDQVTRIPVVVGVAYGSDVDKAMALMREAAEQHPKVLSDPEPVVSFDGFGDNALTLMLRAHIDQLEHRIAIITDLHKAINQKFAEAGVSIAFPQRDLHLDTRGPLRVSVEESRRPGAAE